MTIKRFQRASLWALTALAGFGAVMFGIQAAITLLEHPDWTGELYGMGTASAACMFAFTYLKGVAFDREERTRDAMLARAMSRPALDAAQPRWAAGPAPEQVPARIERDCPYCAERILVAAKLCKHCHSDVSNA